MKNLNNHFTKIDAKTLRESGIYKITNLINNKIYVGSTRMSFYKRFSSHKLAKKGCKLLIRAFNKYNLNNFKFEIIEILNHNDPNLRKKESYWIEFYKSYLPNFGYNIIKEAEETTKYINMKKVIRFNKKEEFIKLYNSIKEAAIENNLSISEISNCCKSVKNINKRSKTAKGYNWIYNDDFIKGLRPIIGKRIVTRRKVNQYDKNMNLIKKYNSFKEASESVNIDSSSIARCCRGDYKTSGGFIWKYEN